VSEVTVVFAGDFCPVGWIGPMLARRRGREVFAGLDGRIADGDLAVVNLECPLTTRRRPDGARSAPGIACTPAAPWALRLRSAPAIMSQRPPRAPARRKPRRKRRLRIPPPHECTIFYSWRPPVFGLTPCIARPWMKIARIA